MWVKICGVTSDEALEAALEAGADAVGFVFAPSVRQIDPERAARLARRARGRVGLVAVTLHPTQHQVDEIVRVLRPDALQTDFADLSGLSLPAYLMLLPVVRTAAEPPSGPQGRVLFEGQRSGSGEIADWSAAQRLARVRELVLAGGLHAANIAPAIRAVRPFGVDVSSGVETAPGRKSPEKIAQFVAAARAAFKES
jgi:phosphoribosylanthranilate isomerase